MKHYLLNKVVYNGQTVTDIYKSFKFIDGFKRDVKYTTDYAISDGETPEMVSYTVYGVTDWWWIILILNDIQDPFYDWPLSNDELESWAKKLVPDWETNPTTYMAKLTELVASNETNRNIKLLKEEYINKIVEQLKGLNV